jgi:hypothetical protein
VSATESQHKHTEGSAAARAEAAREGIPGVGVRPTWEPWVAGLLLVVAIGFGFLVQHRSVHSERRRTDAGVFFRAGYAARVGLDPYTIPDENDWYFLYPPAVAIGFVPVADPPPLAAPDDGRIASSPLPDSAARVFLPYPVSVALWYALSVAMVVVCVECLSRALIGGAADPRVRALRLSQGGWWNIRFWPLLMALPDILSTLSRGQINMVILACISAGILLLSRSKSFWGGFLLAAAAGIKVIPGILLFDVISRRGGKAILGYIACGLVMMAAVPVIYYGPERAYDLTKEWTQRVLLAGILGSEERLQAGAGFSDTDNLSIQGTLHNLANLSIPRGQRPPEPEAWVKLTHLFVSVGLLAATIIIGGFRKPVRPVAIEIMLRTGMLCCVMLLAAPMVHRHYYVMIMPALAGLTFINLMRSRQAIPNGWGAWLIPLYPLVMSIPRLAPNGEGILRDLPIPLLVNLVVWGLCARELLNLVKPKVADPCRTCGYERAGLRPGTPCPECGATPK